MTRAVLPLCQASPSSDRASVFATFITASARKGFLSPATGTRTLGVNYNETIFGYDVLNRRNRFVSPGGTITRSVFDARDLPIEVWVGTNDTGATWLDPTGGGAPGNNMVLVTGYQYDNSFAGLDGNRTAEIQHVDASTVRETNFSFDWRDRPVLVTAAQDWYQVTTLDNLGRAIQLDQYAKANANLIRHSQTMFDDCSRVYQTIRFAVDPTTGAVGNSLVDNTWYDAADNAIKQLPAGSAAFTKTVIDGAGRQTLQYFGYTPAGSSSSSSSLLPLPPHPQAGTRGWGEGGLGSGSVNDVTSDIIVEQTETTFDDASNAIQTTFRQRYHNATGTGPLTYPGGVQPVARVTYVASYPDAIGREQANANYGTNGSVILSRPSTIPARADTVLVTTTVVNPRGEAYQTIDPAGRLDQTTYDDAGRRTELVLNVRTSSSSSSSFSSSASSGGLPTSDDQNNTTLWSYTADSQIFTVTALNSATGNQVTTFNYGTTLGTSDVARNDLLSSTVYADGGTVSYLANRQSERKELIDQNGTVHAYGLDLLARPTTDSITTLGAGVDGSVLCIGRTYEVRGNLEHVTSFSDAAGTNVVNDVLRIYNFFEQRINEYQEHSGAVNTATSVAAGYVYADGSANTIRQTGLVYPNGRIITLDYGAASGIDDALSRVASFIDDEGTNLVSYTCIGVDTFVQQVSAQPQIAWSLINGNRILFRDKTEEKPLQHVGREACAVALPA